MHTILSTFVLRLRQSYWFWPSVLAVSAVFAAWGMTGIDALWGNAWVSEKGLIRPIDIEGAREILSTVAGAILSTAGVAFSVTIVAVSFASGNYGPRLIGNFMRDRTNQFVLGVFVATFVYSLTVLSMVHVGGSDDLPAEFVPQLSVLLALVLTLASIGALIVYIHHVPESIDIMNLACNIGEDLRRSIAKMHEEHGGHSNIDIERPAGDRPAHDCVLEAEEAGYVQSYDVRVLDRAAAKAGVQVEILRGAGDFVVRGEPLLAVRPAERVNGQVAHRLVGAVTIGANRTGLQDVLFLSDQLVEVLARALSPSVNDPYTGMLCLDWLRSGMSHFAAAPPIAAPSGDERVVTRPISFEAMMTRSFDRMRQYVAGDRTVTLHALAVLADIAVLASTEARARSVCRTMERLAASAADRLEERTAREEVGRAFTAHLSAVAAARQAGRRAPGETTDDEGEAEWLHDETA